MFAADFYENIFREFKEKAHSFETEGKSLTSMEKDLSQLLKLNLSGNGLESLENIEILSSVVLKLNLSKNRLKDLRPLTKFSQLIELNLSENQVKDVQPLASLNRLEILDLRGNLIRDCSALQPIKSLRSLRCIFLDGNPLCASLAYPQEVWDLLPSLYKIDNYERAGGSSFALINSISNKVPNIVSADYLLSLELQLKALNSTFEVQEQLLAKQAKIKVDETKKQLLNQILLHQEENQFQKFPEAQGLFSKIENSYRDIGDTFPFYRLLVYWRNEMLRTLTKLLHLQQHHEQLFQQKKKLQISFSREKEETEVRIITLEKRLSVQHEKLQFLEQEKVSLLEQISQQKNAHHQAWAKFVEYRDVFASLSQFLQRFQEEQSGQQIAINASILQKIDRLKDYENRLATMHEKLESVSELLHFKELQLRNGKAMLELERRLFDHQRIKYSHESTKREPSSSSGNLSKHDVYVEEGMLSKEERLLSNISIPAECESFLKTIFYQLDFSQSGLVPVELIVKLLLVSPFPLDPSCLSTLPSGHAQQNCEENALSTLGYLLRSALQNNDLFTIFLDNLFKIYIGNPLDDLSWGELLLQFIPVIESNETTAHAPSLFGFPSSMNRQEIRQLCQNNLVESVYFSVLPYQVRGGLSFANTSSSFPSAAPASIEEIENLYKNHVYSVEKDKDKQGSAAPNSEAEMERLRLEKRLLNHQLQQLTRQMTRTAEMVRSFYDSKLLIAEQKEKKFEVEKLELEGEITRLRYRVDQLTINHQEVQTFYEETKQTSDRTIKELQEQLQYLQKNEVDSSSSRWKEYERLELQHQNLLSQSKKKDTQHAILQKQFERLKVDLEKTEKEKALLQNKHQAELEALEEKRVEEMNSLHLLLQQSQSQLIAVNQRAIELEEERHQLLKKLEGKEAEERKTLALIKDAGNSPQANPKDQTAILPTNSSSLNAAVEVNFLSRPTSSSIRFQQIEQRIGQLLQQTYDS